MAHPDYYFFLLLNHGTITTSTSGRGVHESSVRLVPSRGRATDAMDGFKLSLEEPNPRLPFRAASARYVPSSLEFKAVLALQSETSKLEQQAVGCYMVRWAGEVAILAQ